jgi:hypothetical protein
MTKDKARKAAARARAAETGERYVVARRAIEHEPDTGGDGLFHRLTHRVPGVPAHVEGGLASRQNQPHRPHRQPVRAEGHHGRPNPGEPRVLAGWQDRIARLVGAKQ